MKRKSKDVNQATEARSENKKQPGSALSAALLPVLLGIVLMAALIWQLHEASSSEQSRQQTRVLAEAYNQQLQLLLGITDANAKTLPAHPALVSALLRQDDDTLARLEHEWAQTPYLDSVVIMKPGSKRADKPLSFAALDHLGLAATSQQSSLEYIAGNDSALFYQASPIMHPQQSRVIGTLLLVYDAQALLGKLFDFSTDGSWQVSLQQQLPQAPIVELYRAGSVLQDGLSQSFTTAHPYWQLNIAVDRAALQDSPWLLHYSGLLLILLLSALAALLLLRSRMQQQQANDIATLIDAVKQRQPDLLKDLAGTTLQPAAEPLRKLLSRNAALETAPPAALSTRPEAAATPNSLSSVETSESAPATSTAARAQNESLDDALEIDILDLQLDESALQAAIAASSDPAQVEPGIFRAYDIRGVVGKDLHADTAYWIGRAIGSESIACGEARVVVGRDGRLSSEELQQALVRGLVDTGCSVLDLGMVPTPLVYFATHQLDATSGVMITGSHNPPDYNGFKVVIAGETLASERITALHQRIISQDLASGAGSMQTVNLLDQYVEYISNDITLDNQLTVVIDCGNGVASVIAQRLLESIGCTVIPLFCEVDGTFPNHHPDPGKPENLQDLIRKVLKTGADLGLAFDGDADRLGVVTNKGEIIYSDRLLMLLADDVVSRNPGCDVIYDVKCTRRLAALVSRNGGRPIMWKTGHSLMKAKMQETGALLGGEMSGHIYLKERWFGFDDGIYAAARLLEILSMKAGSADLIFARYPVSPSTPELNIEVTEDSKFAIIRALEESADWGDGNLTALDGIRIDYPNGWGLIRASNTTPMLVLRFEGETEEDLQQIQNLFRDRLLAVAPDIHWPF